MIGKIFSEQGRHSCHQLSLLLGAAVIVLASSAFAGPMDDLVDCTRSCSAHCEALARRVGQLVNDVEANCGGRANRRDEIVQACQEGFHSADEQRCITSAHSADSVRTCLKKFVVSWDELRCVEAGRPTGVIVLCSDTFVMTDDELSCIELAHSASHVQTCASQHLSDKDRLRCLGAH